MGSDVVVVGGVEVAEAPNSDFFYAPKAQQSKSGTGKVRKLKPDASGVEDSQTSDIDFEEVALPSGGSFRFSIDVDLYRITEQEREFIFSLVDQIRDFEDTVGDLDDDDDNDF